MAQLRNTPWEACPTVIASLLKIGGWLLLASLLFWLGWHCPAALLNS